ncbi:MULTISPECIES: DEAD/DEAH box helicase family protein [Bifidobacterium]|nr:MULTISPECIES: DEAD/DEAH box helicase family protein [Bifidobacterium]
MHDNGVWQRLRFRGEFRDYQQRVLDASERHAADGHIHVVAPPGSGKTILGLELIRRYGSRYEGRYESRYESSSGNEKDVNALVLSPTVAIADQWRRRFVENFRIIDDANGTDGNDNLLRSLVSDDLRHPKALTSVTYQALHAAVSERGGKVDSIKADSTRADDGSSANGIADTAANTDTKNTDGANATANTKTKAAAESPEDRERRLLAALVDRLVAAGVRIICLDEAHHLRREWQRILESFVAMLRADPRVGNDILIIALTATPPYDANANEWKRYTALCGDIDKEIFTPELVKHGDLCPHQDFVMLSYPTPAEAAEIHRFRIKAGDAVRRIVNDDMFAQAIVAAGIATDGRQTQIPPALYEHPDDYLALLVMMSRRDGMTPPKRLIRLVTAKHMLPAYRMSYAQRAFRFIVGAPELFGKSLSEQLKRELTRLGMTDRGRVCLLDNDKLTRRLMSSSGKLESIGRIVRHESAVMGERLRMLVLTDYIRADEKRRIGDDRPITSMGLVPIFETIRRTMNLMRASARAKAMAPDTATPDAKTSKEPIADVRIGPTDPANDFISFIPLVGAVSGSLTIMPTSLTDDIDRLAAAHRITPTYRPLPDERYCEVDLGPSNGAKIAVVTELVEAGLLHVLIGTKSLLGEGWDSPSVNTLVLASTVGSFMLTNQMRGRAIRSLAADPHKVANIWHLAAVEPEHLTFSDVGEQTMQWLDPPDDSTIRGDDFAMLRRRFDCFLGPSYMSRSVESGIDRLGVFTPPYDRDGIARINTVMLRRSANRARTAELWHDAIDDADDRVSQAVQLDRPIVPPKALLLLPLGEILAYAMLSQVVGLMVNVATGMVRSSARSGANFGFWPTMLVCGAMALVPIGRTVMRWRAVMVPRQSLFALSCAVLDALRGIGAISSGNRGVPYDRAASNDRFASNGRFDESPDSRMFVTIEDVPAPGTGGESALRCMLVGGTRREQVVFAETMAELLSPIDNPHYVIVGREWGVREYGVSLPCPAMFARRRRDVEVLRASLQRHWTGCTMIDTHTEEGRRILLRCRTRSFLNRGGKMPNTVTTLVR